MAKRRKRQKTRFSLSHLLKPQASNKYRSKLLHPQSLLIVSFVLLAFFSLANALRFFPGINDKVLGSDSMSDISVNGLLEKTNAERQQLGLKELTLNEELNQAALAKAQDMFNQQYWAHVSPDGKQAWDFIKESNYSYKYAGENLARDLKSDNEVMEAWKNSDSHYKNIVNPDFTQMGLAVVNGNLKGFNTTLVVQFFAVPSSVAMKAGNGEEFLLPKASAGQEDTKAVVAGETSFNKELIFSKLNVTRTFFLLVVLLIILTLVYDAFIASSRKYQRLVGQNFAHIALLVTVAFLLVLFKGGAVLP